MNAHLPAPLLRRVKSWQLVGLGISGWVTLYSVAIITWGTGSNIIGNAQGGCFAITMTLASLEARRFKTGSPTAPGQLTWVGDLTTEQLNQTLKQFMQKQEFRVEAAHATEAQMGFGVRAVGAGRTLVFETAQWKEPVIDLPHVQTTEENRKKVMADLAVIVGVGLPREDAGAFVKSHPLQLLTGNALKNLLAAEKPPVKKT
jgi:hypothetical protein